MPRSLCPPYSNFKMDTQVDWVRKNRAKITNQAVMHRSKFNSTEPGVHTLGMMPRVGRLIAEGQHNATA